MVKSFCPENGVVLDPFAGSGTTVDACIKHNRQCVAFEINPDYCNLIQERARRRTAQARMAV